MDVQNFVLIGIAGVLGLMYITAVAWDQISDEMEKEEKQ